MQPTTCPQSVLLVDDDAIAAYLLRENLRYLNRNSALHYHRNPLNALAQLAQMPRNSVERWPDVIFIDLNTSHCSGWDFLDQYQKLANAQGLQTPIYVLTDMVTDGIRLRCECYTNLNIQTLEKPMTYEVLRGVLLPKQRKVA